MTFNKTSILFDMFIHIQAWYRVYIKSKTNILLMIKWRVWWGCCGHYYDTIVNKAIFQPQILH